MAQNVLFIIIDQLRADCLTGALADSVALPNIRALAAAGVTFSSHYSVTSPCGPSRVSLLTGQYACNHRAVRNGTPLRHGTATLGTAARQTGHDPLLFGYTDTAQDPRFLDPEDPRLFSYEELAEGFTEVTRMRMESDSAAWEAHLAERGYDLPGYPEIYRPDGDDITAPARYKARDSDTAFLTDRVIDELGSRDPGWFALVTYIRPHPPFVAPEPYNRMYDPAAMPAPRASQDADWHPFVAAARRSVSLASTVVGFPDLKETPETVAKIRALYLGLASEVDHHVGRLVDWLKQSGQYDDTLIVLTADHGEMLGDFGLWGKRSFHDASFHVPLVIRAPGSGAPGRTVSAPTESIDLAPTVLDWIGAPIPHSMDGHSLRPWLDGRDPEDWRRYSYSELDFGDPLSPTVWQRELGLALDEANLAVLRRGDRRLVQFAGGLEPILLDLARGGEDRNFADSPQDAQTLLDLTRDMLCHRMQHSDGTFSRTMITDEGVKVAAI